LEYEEAGRSAEREEAKVEWRCANDVEALFRGVLHVWKEAMRWVLGGESINRCGEAGKAHAKKFSRFRD